MATPLSLYPYNPQSQPGFGGPFGGVPGPVSIPSPSTDLGQQIPGLPAMNAQAGSNVLAELMGKLSPETLRNLQNASATYAAKSGMPGTNAITGTLANNQDLLSNVFTSQQLQQQGLQDYSKLIPTVSTTQTVSPTLQADIANRNAINAAAPNPTQSANYAKQLFDQYAATVRGPAGGTGSTGLATTQPASPTRTGGFPDPNVNAPPAANPMYADEWDAVFGMGPASSTGAGTLGSQDTSSLGDIFSGGAEDIFAGLFGV